MGQEDIATMQSLMTANNGSECTSIQILTHGLGAGVAVSNLADGNDGVNMVTNLAPCLVPSFFVDSNSDSDSSDHS